MYVLKSYKNRIFIAEIIISWFTFIFANYMIFRSFLYSFKSGSKITLNKDYAEFTFKYSNIKVRILL